MKLVELLAKKVSEWHEDTAYVFQDQSGTIYCTSKGRPKYKASWQEWNVSPSSIEMSANDSLYGVTLDVASDHAESVIDRSQWQAERDRQKGGEWKRHRGGKCPVPAGTKVSTRHRDGEVVDVHFQTAQYGTHKAVMDCVWKHDGSKNDIMAYRVISQPQAEEVVMKGPFVAKAANQESTEIEVEDFINSGTCREDQIDGPIKWRDTIIHCQAIIEDCERDIERNVQLLDSEGLMMQVDSKRAMQAYAPDVIPLNEWQVGDIVEIISLDTFSDPSVRVGDHMPIIEVDKRDDTVKVDSGTWGDEDNYRFIRRP